MLPESRYNFPVRVGALLNELKSEVLHLVAAAAGRGGSQPDAGQVRRAQAECRNQRERSPAGQQPCACYTSTPGSGPVLSAKRSTGAPNASNIDTYRFASGVSSV